MSLEQDRPTASSVENQSPSIQDGQVVVPSTIRGQIAEIFEAITTKNADSRDFLLRVVQPGLAGLMDGSVSTLAPIFATAFATHQPFTAFLVGMASATGAGISMAFSEALSDDGELTGRGSPVIRGAITGIMTFVGGSLHTLPFLFQHLQVALALAYVVVAVELVVIAAIRHRFFGTSWWLSMVQVVGGGILVFVAALLFGNA
jgi:erythrin-vacuolar iron transport family protein